MVADMSDPTIRLRDTATGAVDFPKRYEFIDSEELALRWNLPESWIREQVRKRRQIPSPTFDLPNTSVFAGAAPNSKSGLSGV